MSIELNADELRACRRKARESTLNALRALGGEATRQAIHDRALADGGFTPRELAAAPPPKAADKHDRYVDYQLSWVLTNLKRDGLLENPRRGTWRLVGAALELSAPASGPQVRQVRAPLLRRLLAG